MSVGSSEKPAAADWYKALFASTERFRLLSEATFESIAITEAGILLDCNEQFTELVGRPRRELLGRPVRDLVAPEHQDLDADAQRAGRLDPYELDVLHPARGRVSVEVRARSARVSGRDVHVTALRDISERKRAEQLLRANSHKLESIFRAAPTGIGVVVNRVFTEVNERACEMVGYARDELLGRSSRCVYPDDAEYEAVGLAKYDQIRLSGTGTVETRWVRKDGAAIDVLLSSSPIDFDDWSAGVTFTALDITERKRMDEDQERLRSQLVQAQKMESIGRLAGGVAHDFNNMLQAILGNVSLALDEPADSPQLQDYLHEIQKAATRSGELTRQLLAFARRQPVRPRVLDLNDTISGMLKMLQRLIGEDIQLVWQPAASLWPVRVDPSQIDQLLANLAVNARDAIAGVGRITIETANVTMPPGLAPECQPGDYVRCAVRDTGCGMDAHTLSHVFEPFFTTKEAGRGTGLGLATVYGIVKQNGGFIDVDSAPGTGTVMAVYLPRVEPAVGTRAADTAAAAAGTETVLLVEDEEQVLTLVSAMLTRRGYTVLAAARPEEALAIARRHPGPIDLLLTDVVMPGMNGRDLRACLEEIRPGAGCLFVSGYTADVIANRGVLDEGVQFLQKPFSESDLARRVREVLADRSRADGPLDGAPGHRSIG
jgi:two-component system, cell cycle sensor histidine kinase and response regulator CckA